jgi:hypothetical protein
LGGFSSWKDDAPKMLPSTLRSPTPSELTRNAGTVGKIRPTRLTCDLRIGRYRETWRIPTETMNHQALSSFIWSVVDLLRGDYKQSKYGKVILPFTILRRLDCVLEVTKPTVLSELVTINKTGPNADPFLRRITERAVYNTSQLDLVQMLPNHPRTS